LANTDAPFGLRPVKHKSGAPYNGAFNLYYIPSTDNTAVYIGDPVVIVGDSNDNEVRGFPPGSLSEVARATVGDGNAITGVVVGVMADTRDSLTYRAASTERVLMVADDPDLIFEIQADGTLTADSVGLNAVLIATHAGSTVTGRSGMELDTTSDTPAADSSNQLYIVGLKPVSNNDLASANSVALVTIINHTNTPGNVSIGVA
jgi:hypothetical protein